MPIQSLWVTSKECLSHAGGLVWHKVFLESVFCVQRYQGHWIDNFIIMQVNMAMQCSKLKLIIEWLPDIKIIKLVTIKKMIKK